jgi:hypothetical protein
VPSVGRKKIPLIGHPAFPFIDQGKDPWYKSEREGKKREKRWRRQPRSCIALPPRAGPVGPADDNGGTRMLWLCLSPALQAGVAVLVMISPSVTGATDGRRPVPPCHAIWPTDLV